MNKENEIEIKFDKRNYRKHSDKNKKVIRKSLEELGAGRSVLIDADGSLIAGNGVYEQAQRLGIPVEVVKTDGKKLVVVQRTDLHEDDDKRKRLALADNSASDTSEFDVELLKADFDLGELDEWGVDLPEIDVEEIAEAKEDDFDEDKDQIEQRCEKGDIWQLGEHRLMCGDSTDADAVEKLMGGGKGRPHCNRPSLWCILHGEKRIS